jgi:dTMP kinase
MEKLGRYIVIEGNDGTGKSTQVEMLMQNLESKGHDVVMIEEPGSEKADRSTPIANDLRQVIKNGNLHRDPEINLTLFSAARRELWEHMIAPALGRGAIVLSARNYFSTLAYQGRGEGLSEDLIIEKTRLYTSERYMSPDLLLVLTLEDETERAARISGRGTLETPDTFESRGDDFQSRVNNGYLAIARERGIPTISCLDGARGKTREEIQEEICQQPLIASLLDGA